MSSRSSGNIRAVAVDSNGFLCELGASPHAALECPLGLEATLFAAGWPRRNQTQPNNAGWRETEQTHSLEASGRRTAMALLA